MRLSFSKAVLQTAGYLDAKTNIPIVPDVLYAFYGLITGTEFCGTDVCRSLGAEWKSVAQKKAASANEQEFGAALYTVQCKKELVAIMQWAGVSPEDLARADLYNQAFCDMMDTADSLMEEGYSRLSAQKKVIEDTRNELRTTTLTPNS